MEDLMETQTTQTVQSPLVEGGGTNQLTLNVSALPTLGEVERQYLFLVLKSTGGNKVKAAKILGVTVKTIYNKLDGYKANETLRPSTQGS
jgi:DNA-binding NtrC family response regulator